MTLHIQHGAIVKQTQKKTSKLLEALKKFEYLSKKEKKIFNKHKKLH
jgi:hypothetical protein